MIVESYEDVIVLSGALRSNYWETLHTAISLMLKRHPSGVIIDCSGLTEATPEGGTTFRDVMEFIRNQDGRVIVAAVPRNILEVLRTVTEVRSQLAIANSVEDARASLDLIGQQKPLKKKFGAALGKIVVCVTGKDVDREALHIATQLVNAREAELHIAYIILVPRDLPLTAPLPKEEGHATKVLQTARGLTDKHVVFIPHIERGRDVATTLEELVLRIRASTIIYPVCTSNGDAEANANGKILNSLFIKIPQQLIVVRGQIPAAVSH